MQASSASRADAQNVAVLEHRCSLRTPRDRVHKIGGAPNHSGIGPANTFDGVTLCETTRKGMECSAKPAHRRYIVEIEADLHDEASIPVR
jgi:hypothetical protein